MNVCVCFVQPKMEHFAVVLRIAGLPPPDRKFVRVVEYTHNHLHVVIESVVPNNAMQMVVQFVQVRVHMLCHVILEETYGLDPRKYTFEFNDVCLSANTFKLFSSSI